LTNIDIKTMRFALCESHFLCYYIGDCDDGVICDFTWIIPTDLADFVETGSSDTISSEITCTAIFIATV